MSARQIYTSNASQNWATGIFAYDGAGNIRTMRSDSFAYDYFSRLTQATFASVTGSPVETFTYDDYGNMTQFTWSGSGGGTFSLPTSSATNHLTYDQYDNLGNILYDGTGYYYYNALSRHWRSNNYFSFSEDYSYDASGERLARKPSSGGGASYDFTLRDESSRVRTEYLRCRGVVGVRPEFVYYSD